ncbi:hypothetical protein HHK36_029437 [Tetracentron sinense]|uniref:FHA domain-containing protein n=1 Tax=Tetracentron sinense TaxID=13715 RepID=A0A835D1S9_TETSI|nr:hypothetical protein HHK36_029437 [Tetracentron sinense]
MEIQESSKRKRGGVSPFLTATAGHLYLKSIGVPLISSSTGSPCKSICLRSDRLYTIGRKNWCCDFFFEDRRVSKQHCQIFFDGFERRIFILDGFFLHSGCHLDEIRRMFRYGLEGIETKECFSIDASSNGVFVNGFRLGKGTLMELSAGDQVSFVRESDLDCSSGIRIGFVVERVVFTEEVVPVSLQKQLTGEAKDVEGNSEAPAAKGKGNRNKLDFSQNEIYNNYTPRGSGYGDLIRRSLLLLSQCRHILHSADPISYIRGCVNLSSEKENRIPFISNENNFQVTTPHNIIENPLSCKPVVKVGTIVCHKESVPLGGLEAEQKFVNERAGMVKLSSILLHRKTTMTAETASVCVPSDPFQQIKNTGISGKNAIANDKPQCPTAKSTGKAPQVDSVLNSKKNGGIVFPSDGNIFYLNRLEFIDPNSSDQHTVVSLPELLYPVESLSRIFIATFTSDVLWFLSYCKVPNQLPVTIACHNTERCWSSSPEKRTLIPFLEFPNVVVLYPPFPEVVAFSKDRKRQGIACHHPKLLLLQREDSIRVVITSANLVPKQWNSVTNTVWWQDFPCRSAPDYSSLFTRISDDETIQDSKSDFAAQLAGFMASLIADAPIQAHWIVELTKYDFRGAVGHLVASIPGIHNHNTYYPLESMHFLSANQFASRLVGVKLLGSVEASVVGLSHLFHTASDTNGAQLKTLASFLGRCRENTYGMSEVVLRRTTNVPADSNAVSVLVSNLDEFSEGDYVQLGFLPRNVAKWVAPLCDIGFFTFSACVRPKEALAAALGESNSKGPNFSEITRMMQPEHVPAICSLVASMQRYVGLWRLQEVLGRYKWPELLETDFIYGSSSIGTSLNAQFLAAFSAAAGKRSFQFSESDESDPEWGRWNTSQELKTPSMRIIFPTIERVKDAACGIWPSRRMLCFSERTWQRLKNADILHDAIPHPRDRVGYPMHVKVARRRFQSKTDAASFGWVYCGSHNFSAAAWGRPVCNFSGVKADRAFGPISDLGSYLHICNYELGIIFVVPPSDALKGIKGKSLKLDDIILPFVVPAPKYQPTDRPATAQAMREALAQLTEQEKEESIETAEMEEMINEEILDEEEIVEATDYVSVEKEEERAYAEMLWSQVELSES